MVCGLWTAVAVAQSTTDYSLQIGAPSFSTSHFLPGGTVNIANGNLQLEIPLGKFDQKKGVSLTAKLVYNSRFYYVLQTGSSGSWNPYNAGYVAPGWSVVMGPGISSQLVNKSYHV